jgi:hypothetical protein
MLQRRRTRTSRSKHGYLRNHYNHYETSAYTGFDAAAELAGLLPLAAAFAGRMIRQINNNKNTTAAPQTLLAKRAAGAA